MVVLSQVNRITHIALEGQNGAQRYLQRLGRPCGARRAHQQERRTGVQQFRRAIRLLTIQGGPEVVITRVLWISAGHDDGGAASDLVQLGAIMGIGHDPACLGAAQSLFDRLGAECSEERLVDRADAPGTQNGNQQFNRAWHQARYTVSRLDPLLP